MPYWITGALWLQLLPQETLYGECTRAKTFAVVCFSLYSPTPAVVIFGYWCAAYQQLLDIIHLQIYYPWIHIIPFWTYTLTLLSPVVARSGIVLPTKRFICFVLHVHLVPPNGLKIAEVLWIECLHSFFTILW